MTLAGLEDLSHQLVQLVRFLFRFHGCMSVLELLYSYEIAFSR